MSDACVRVTVVVPVYNPGVLIEALIDSLAAQTLPQDQFEVVFSDDGSTDSSPERLDRLARERENVRVLHEPNSGWPGRPRNLGMDIARGDYVFFADQDDWLGTEALERMSNFGDANNSDIVIGRYAGHHRGVARATFRKTQPNATLENTPLMDSLTPHKMFRTAFLRENGIRFPEGRRRLEDHVFVATSYFLAKRISVLADYLCYFHVGRDDAGNAGYQRIDPSGYYGNVREVVDIVLEHTRPGGVQDRCLRRTLRTEVLARLDGAKFLEQDGDYQQAIFDEGRQLVLATMPLTVDAGLTAQQRVRAALLRAGNLADLTACVRHFLDVQPAVRLLDLRWEGAGELVVDIEAGLVDQTAAPWRYDCAGEQIYLRSPGGLHGPFPRDAAECSKQLHAATVQILVRRREDSEEWPVATKSTVSMHREAEQVWASMTATARVDPRTLAGGSPLKAGLWDVYARVSQTGWTKDAALGAHRSPSATHHRRAALLAAQLVVPRWTRPRGALGIDVSAHLAWVMWGAHRRCALRVQRRSSDRHSADGHSSDRHGADSQNADSQNVVNIQLPLFVPPGVDVDARLRLTGPTDPIDVLLHAARLSTDDLVLDGDLPVLAPGSWTVSMALDERGEPAPVGARLSVSAAGRIRVRRAVPADLAEDLARTKQPSLARRARRRLRRRLRAMRRR